MKYNLGSGSDYRFGWLNVDREPETAPDVVWDLATFPWPFESDSADEVAMLHLLDEMPPGLLPRLMQELYRLCRNGAKVTVLNTDPRHADAALKPLGAGGVTPTAFQSYDLGVVEGWLAAGLRHTPTALHARVDFAARSTNTLLDARWTDALRDGEASEALTAAMLGQNNVVACAETVLEARKPFSPGRTLAEADALVLVRFGGLGDVLMALAACRAIKSVSDRPIYLLTAPAYRGVAALCPFVDHVFVEQSALDAHASASGREFLKRVDLSPVRFGLSRSHQLDAYLEALALSPDDREKRLDLDLSRTSIRPWIDAALTALPTGSRRVILHPGVSHPNRTWDWSFWRDIAECCLALGHSVITVGQNHAPDGKGVTKLDHGRVLDLSDRINLAETLHVMRQCDLFISADAGPIQLAGASDIAIIGLYSVVKGEQRLPYRNGLRHYKAAAVSPDCTLSPCYRWMSNPDVTGAFTAVTGLNTDTLDEFFAQWCVAAERYACTREAGVADKVKALIPAMLAQVKKSNHFTTDHSKG